MGNIGKANDSNVIYMLNSIFTLNFKVDYPQK